MPELISSVSNAVQLVWDDHTYPDQVLVRANGFSYTVYPHERTMTIGDLDAIKMLAAPNEQTNGAVMRIATVYDETLAASHGFKNRAYFVRVLSTGPDADPERLRAGSYYELSGVGSGTELDTQEPLDPEFRMIWLDASEVMSDGIEPGNIFVRGFVETTNARYDPDQDFIFVENELGDYSATALLVDRYWARYGAASATAFQRGELPGIQYPTGREMIQDGLYYETAPLQLNEQLDTYRLHSRQEVRLECIEEMIADIKEKLADRRLPDDEIQKAVQRRQGGLSYSMSF